nr:unnamed protein product [Callosobruchus chinensis]
MDSQWESVCKNEFWCREDYQQHNYGLTVCGVICFVLFYLENEKLDILGISETWLTDMVTSDVLYIEGYSLIRKDREVGRGGGVLIYIKDSLKYQAIDVFGNIEQLFVKINCRDYNFVLGVAYKPPTVNYKYFIDSLEVSFTIASTYSENILFLGDVNINFLSADSVATKYFNSMLTSLGLNQLVSEPTHIANHSTSLIDIVLTNNVNFIDSTFVRASNFSLRECVGCNIKFMKPRNEPKYFTYRDFKNFDADSFHHDLSSSNLDHIFFVSDVDEKIKLFNSILTTLFEKHVPLKTIQITRRKAPWINDKIKMLMSERDKARAKLKRNKTDSNLKQYRDLRNRTNFEILKLKQEFFSKLSNVRDTKKVWNEFRQLNVNHTSSNHISDTFPDPDILNNHFVDSIPQIGLNGYSSERVSPVSWGDIRQNWHICKPYQENGRKGGTKAFNTTLCSPGLEHKAGEGSPRESDGKGAKEDTSEGKDADYPDSDAAELDKDINSMDDRCDKDETDR